MCFLANRVCLVYSLFVASSDYKYDSNLTAQIYRQYKNELHNYLLQYMYFCSNKYFHLQDLSLNQLFQNSITKEKKNPLLSFSLEFDLEPDQTAHGKVWTVLERLRWHAEISIVRQQALEENLHFEPRERCA